jgi:hypothetical protein
MKLKQLIDKSGSIKNPYLEDSKKILGKRKK